MQLEELKTYKMKDLCKMFGVHRNTIMNKTKKYSIFWKNKKYKTLYTVEDVEIIRRALSS
jgi:hypothetical protein